jgi:menaquinone-9 beta-reductase
MERELLCQNPHLKKIFEEAVFVYKKPLVINEISFAPKEAVFNHMLMVGDTAGLITPLCGNGMAMAIHGAKLATDLVIKAHKGELKRSSMELQYMEAWQRQFGTRLLVGRLVQRLFGKVWLTEIGLRLIYSIRPLFYWLVKRSHGKVF